MQSSLHHTLRERSGEMNPHPRFVGCARRESVPGFPFPGDRLLVVEVEKRFPRLR